MNLRPLGLLLMLSLVGAIAHLAWAAGQLPEVVASHFGADGRADSHSTRTAFLATYGVVILVLGASFGGIGAMIPRLPDAAINIPHRSYWLAPERRASTLERIADQLALMGAVTMGLMVATMHLVVTANREGRDGLPWVTWLLFGLYMAFTLVWTVRLVRAFRLAGPR